MEQKKVTRDFKVLTEKISPDNVAVMAELIAMRETKALVINTIIVKDLSRFGRNYIEVGQYVDYVFPAFGIRFIAIQDNVDTENRDSGAMEMMPIMNVFNEWHAANTSKKIRAVLKSNAREGKYHASLRIRRLSPQRRDCKSNANARKNYPALCNLLMRTD